MYAEQKEVLTSKQTNIVTNKLKAQTWEKIAAACRQLNPAAGHTVENVKVRWDNMFTTTKRKVSALRKKVTGGGDPPKPLTLLEEKIYEIFAESTLFHGIGGPESGVQQSTGIAFNNLRFCRIQSLYFE